VVGRRRNDGGGGLMFFEKISPCPEIDLCVSWKLLLRGLFKKKMEIPPAVQIKFCE